MAFYSVSTYANSSWVWLSETRPYDILPLVIVITLAIEVFSIYFFAKVKNISKTVFVVTISNIVSFIAPYGITYIVPSLVTFEYYMEHTPFYIVGFLYYLLTIIIEIPIVFFSLKKNTISWKKLIFTILVSNALTTVITAIIERTLCYGMW